MHDSVSLEYPNTEMRVGNTTQRSIFDEIQGVWIADETLSQVFDIHVSCKSKQILRSKQRSKIVKIYAN